MERDVALDFLHHLMDVAIEHGHRTEALQIGEGAAAVVRAPAPVRIDGPERDMGKNNNRGRSRPAPKIGLKPFELFIAEIAKAAWLQIDDVDEPDEVHALRIKTVPACAHRAAAIAFAVKLWVLVKKIVLAWYVMHTELCLRDDFVGVVKFRRFRQMRDVTGMDQEGWLCRQSANLADRLFERAGCVRIGWLIEADMAVADLEEGKASRVLRERLADETKRFRNAATNRPKDAGAGPDHAFEDCAAVEAIALLVRCHW